jgi:hypothetical protein
MSAVVATAPVAPPARGTGRAELPGLLLARLTLVPVVAAVFFLLVAFPLLLIGEFRPFLVLPLAGLVVLVGVPLTLRRVRRAVPDTPLWAPAAIALIAIGFVAFQLHYKTPFVIVTRDPASYMQFAIWIARHGSTRIPESLSAFGSASGKLDFQSFAFYQQGKTVVPQFMAGWPMVLGVAYWWGGTFAAVSTPPLIGGAAVLTFGGLAARLVGPRWAVAATLTLAVSFPEIFTSRSAYSEPLAQILLLGGLCLLLESQWVAETRSARLLAAVAGLALGITLLVRLDGASDTLPVIPWCAAIYLSRRPQAIPVLAGMAVGTLYGLIDGVLLSRPYLATNISSVAPLAVLAFVVAAASLFAVLFIQQHGLTIPRPRWLPNVAAALPVLVIAATGARALHDASHLINKYNYEAHVIEWIIWLVGLPILVVATVGAAFLAHRVLTGKNPEWVLPLMIFCWTILVFLVHPAITPDMPWASRRLVPAVLPGCILLAAWAASWLTRKLKEHGYAGPPATLFAACCSLALVAPPAWIAFAPHLAGGGMSLRGLATKYAYHGELSAMDKLCAEIPSGSSVVVINGSIADRMLENIRGMCDLPVARIDYPTTAKVQAVIAGIEATGRRAVLLDASATDFSAYPDGTVEEVMNLHTQLDVWDFSGIPHSTSSYQLVVWMWEQNR